MGRKLKGKDLAKKGLKGALARHVVKDQNQKKLSQLSKAHQEQQLLKEKSIKSGGAKKKKNGPVQQNQRGLVPFKEDDKVLLVGEGDFSFAVSIVQQGMIKPENLIATSFDSKDVLDAKYPKVQEHLDILAGEGVQVMHEVDATDLPASLKLVSAAKKTKVLKSHLFKDKQNLNFIMFNFPHTGKGIKDVDRNIADHQKLVLRYFESCKEVFKLVNNQALDDFGGYSASDAPPNHSKIVLTLFEGEPYISWQVKSLARGVDYRVERSGKFDWAMFPEYHHRRTNSTFDTTKPAAERDARVYVFEKSSPRPTKKKEESDEE